MSGALPIRVGMASPSSSMDRAGRTARLGVVGALVAAVGFFDALFLGMPIAVLAASFKAPTVYIGGAIAVSLLSIACCSWVDRRWDEWSASNAGRLEKRLEKMRTSRLMAHPVAWIQRGSDRWYAIAAAVANPILVAALARPLGGQPIGRRRIVLGSVAYAIPYVAMWTLVGLAAGDLIRYS
jgi:hypothetical protein